MQVPSLDLGLYRDGNADSKVAFNKSLGEAFRTYGFAIIKNHGIPQDLVDRFYELSYSFFRLDTATKKKYEIEALAGQRGFTSFGREHAKQSEMPDLKEFYQIGQNEPFDGAEAEMYPKNVFVQEIDGFVETGIELYQAFEKTGGQLLSAIADFLELDTNYFGPKIKGGNSILRTIYYPPITVEPESAIRAESHEDINLITLLVGASAGGLQLLTTEGNWLDVMPKSDEIAINVGDMLQRLTNNYLRSTTHRVINPPRERWSEPRLSIPFFLHPQPDMDLTCLDNCVSADNPAKYEPITSHEYLMERLREIGLKK